MCQIRMNKQVKMPNLCLIKHLGSRSQSMMSNKKTAYLNSMLINKLETNKYNSTMRTPQKRMIAIGLHLSRKVQAATTNSTNTHVKYTMDSRITRLKSKTRIRIKLGIRLKSAQTLLSTVFQIHSGTKRNG
jgi:hypothetical protein